MQFRAVVRQRKIVVAQALTDVPRQDGQARQRHGGRSNQLGAVGPLREDWQIGEERP